MVEDNIFIDANVILEILEYRKKSALAQKTIRKYANTACISTLTCHIVVYVTRKRLDISVIEEFLSDYQLLSLTSEDFTWAYKNRRNEDFEDALQIAIAIRNGCTTFVTFDQEIASTYNNLPTLKMKLLK